VPYTGNLLRLSQQPDALKLGGVSERHGAVEPAQDIARQQKTAPAGTGMEFAGTDFEQVVEAGHGMLLDTPASWAGTPPGSPDTEQPWHIDYSRGNPHSSPAVLSARGAAAMEGGAGYPHPDTASALGMRSSAHSGDGDRGWIRSTFWPAPWNTESQPREEINPDGPSSSVAPPEGVGGAKYGRGINSLGLNNPAGWRNGRYRFMTWPNTVFAQIHRTIGTQMLQPRDIYTPGPQARMIGSMITPPSLPRDAPNPDDVITANSNYTSSASSVIGGGF